ncbi:MAG: NlpC/P60 family protein [Gammaproteobacteria bacterium]|nr:NlpC/P60 family protein [Gammaproteobacteria bacterium]
MNRLLITCATLIVVGCAGPGVVVDLPAVVDLEPAEILPPTNTNALTSQVDLASLLDHHYAVWKGTRHKLGGTTKGGLDCSAFVYLTFQNLFGVELPRTTRQQSKVGNTIKEKHLRAGDLVFFKTGLRARHVGIYINDGTFIHASTSEGVVKSSLSSKYWARHYWKAVRLDSL